MVNDWFQAIDVSKDWHDSLEASGKIKDESGKVIMEFPDGSYWIDLESRFDCSEAKAMGHCGRTNMSGTLLSFRDKNKVPHMTMAISDDYKTYYQLKGKQNKKPIEKYHKYIDALFEKLGINKYVPEYSPKDDFTIEDFDNETYLKYINNNKIDLIHNTEKILPLLNNVLIDKEILKEVVYRIFLGISIKPLTKDDKDNYIINDDLSISTIKNEKINIKINCDFNELPIKFRYVSGDFDISENDFITLKNCPDEVGMDFICEYNNLTSLEGGPEKVGRIFNCAYNKLTSLKGCPKEVKSYFYCEYNNLISLEGCQKRIEGNFDCSSNKLTSLKGCPEIIENNFDCSDNDLITLDYIPKSVYNVFIISEENNFTPNEIYNKCKTGKVILV